MYNKPITLPIKNKEGYARYPCCALNTKVDNRYVICFVGEVLQGVLIMPWQGSSHRSVTYGAYVHPEFRTFGSPAVHFTLLRRRVLKCHIQLVNRSPTF
jgi:hypothetical protein